MIDAPHKEDGQTRSIEVGVGDNLFVSHGDKIPAAYRFSKRQHLQKDVEVIHFEAHKTHPPSSQSTVNFLRTSINLSYPVSQRPWFVTRKMACLPKPKNIPQIHATPAVHSEMATLKVAELNDHLSKQHAGTLDIVTRSDVVGNG